MNDYVPLPDPEGINSEPNPKPLIDVAFLLVGFLAIVTALYFAVAFIGEWAFTRMSLQTELRLFGRFWARDISGRNSADLNDLIGRLQPHVPFPLQISITCSEEPNAFALPGGAILITSGLLPTVSSENGLVFVLGHEIGHFINRDHARGIGRRLTFRLVAALLGFGELQGLDVINDLLENSYSRRQELEADRFALDLIKKIYGHTGGVQEFFVAIEKTEGAVYKSFGKFLSTHPRADERIRFIETSQTVGMEDLRYPERPFSEWVRDLNCSTN